MKERAFAYLRVSGQGQVKQSGFSRQLQAVNKFAQANQVEIVEVYREKGVSGTVEQRPALAEMMVALEQNGRGVNVVLIEGLDRLSRDLMVQEAIIGVVTPNLSGGYAQERFDEPAFWENWGGDASLGLSYRPRIWPNTVLQALANYRHYRFDRDQRFDAPYFSATQITRVKEVNTTDNVALTLGLGSDLTERLNLSLNGGARYTVRETESEVRRRIILGDEEQEGQSSDESSDEARWGFVGSVNLVYRGERNEISLGDSHDLQPASGSGDTVQRTSLNTAWWYQMTSEWRFSASASYYLNRSDVIDPDDRDTDTTTITVAPLVRYAFNRDIYLQGQYRFTQVDDHEDDETSRRHLAALTLSIKHDLLD